MAEEGSSQTAIVEEREELMIPPSTRTSTSCEVIPTLRTAHFLNPTLTLVSDYLPFLPNSTCSSLSSNPIHKVSFSGCISPAEEWQTWVNRLQPTHEAVWRQAGIFDAIKASTFRIWRHHELVISLAERWNPETKTFVFPWGEATVTLEDLMVLGGLSPAGDSVLSLSSQQLEGKLVIARREIGHNVTHHRWVERFMGSGDELEHAAFLAYWLERHVLVTKSSCRIGTGLFSQAARLANGDKIALGPAVLAAIYRDLTYLKAKILAGSSSVGQHNADCNRGLFAPFQWVHLWAWERFPALAPAPRVLRRGEPRLARWSNLRKTKIHNLRTVLDSAGKTFRWRPYALPVRNWQFPRFYGDMEKWVSVEFDGGEWESFARCLRVCRLVGVDCVEEYFPHRVARQFGMDQDIPGLANLTNYNTPIIGMKLYVPPRSFKGDVTVRYLDWWKGVFFSNEHDATPTYKRQKIMDPGNNISRQGSEAFEVGPSTNVDDQATSERNPVPTGQLNKEFVIISDDEGEEEDVLFNELMKLIAELDARFDKLEIVISQLSAAKNGDPSGQSK